ncbi:FAD-dependent oxidoreductase [Mycobacterium sp. NPDC003449]
MATIGEHAVVLGASIGGLLAARVLADFFTTVTVVERDELPGGPAHRRGVPQGRHVHGLLSAGALALEDLFPGFLGDLAADGATVLDETCLSRLSVTLGGHRLRMPARPTEPLVSYLCSRPFLESHIRDRVRSVGNISLLDGHDAVEILTAGEGDRTTGVLVAEHRGGAGRAMDADLVVDAMGRAGRTPAFLESLGYRRPAEDRIAVQVSYTSQLLSIPDGMLDERLIMIGTEPERPCGGALFAYEDDTWMLTLAGMAGSAPPIDRVGMLSYAAEFAPPTMMAALRAGEPLGAVATYRYPASVRRHYERMPEFPAGLLVFGDAICSFNPVYGQGMSVAALEALTLRDCLAAGSAQLGPRFLRAATPLVDRVWRMAAGADLAMPQVRGHRPLSIRISNWFTERVLTAAESDPVVGEAFFRVMNLVASPGLLLRPSILARVATARTHRPAVPATAEPIPLPVQLPKP